MRWLRFILSHSIFISGCAIALCYQTFFLLHIFPDKYVYGLIFFSTLGSYNFYWLISKFYFSGKIQFKDFLLRHFSNLLFFILAATGILCCIQYVPGIIFYLIPAIVLTLVYSIPLWPVKALEFTRRAGFLKTVVLALTWTYVTVIIPAHKSLFIKGESISLLFSARFFFMLMLCIIFDSRDIMVDKIHSLRSLATDVSRNTLQIIMIAVYCLYMICGIFLRYYFDNNAQVIAFIITGIVTLIIYRMSLKKQGYFFYYFIVDGLMLFSAIATYMASI